MKQHKIESAHYASTSSDGNKKRKGKNNADSESSKKRKGSKDEKKEMKCYFCKEAFRFKKECPKYHAWLMKKSTSFALVCTDVNLASVPRYTW